MNFKKDKYIIIRNALDKKVTDFCYRYILHRRNTTNYLFNKQLISPLAKEYGFFGDEQVKHSFAIYGDVAMDTLLEGLLAKAEKFSNKKLIPTYSYCRVYEKGSILPRHKDREACAISATLNLGGDSWPIYVQKNRKKIKVDLSPGDMLLYSGCILYHWRETFEGNMCGQVFLHYNENNDKNIKNIYDGRACLGLPHFVKYYI